jgi:putative membrane protein
MRTIALAFCAAAWLAAGSCLAVTPRPGMYAAVAAAEAKPLPPAQRLERRFLQITASNLRFQSDASRLALARSNNPAVQDLANTVLARQQTTQPELLRLLHARGMALPMPTDAHGKTLKRLARLNGAKFDRLYVDEVVMRSCQDDIANYQKVALHAEDPVLKAWIERQLPTLRFHFGKAGKALPSASLHGQRAV